MIRMFPGLLPPERFELVTKFYGRCNAVTLDHVSADFRKIKTPWEVYL